MAERENTIAAFRAASEIGADAVELDVRRTADGVLVVHHDALVPTGDGSHPIDDLDLARLPTHVPTLGAALDACTGMWVNVEIKNDPREAGFDATDSIADETIAHLLARGTDARWLISSFRIETVDRCRALAPQIRTAWLTATVPRGTAEMLVARGHSAVHPWVERLDRPTVDACRAGGARGEHVDVRRPGAHGRAHRLGHRRDLHERARRGDHCACGSGRTRLTASGRCSNSRRGVSPR